MRRTAIQTEIIYTIADVFGFDEVNKVDYLTGESNNKDKTGYAAIAFTMEKNVSDHFHEILPDELAEYLEKKGYSYQVEEDGEVSKAYILLNVPFRMDVDSDDADNGEIGQKFIRFFIENTDELLDYGLFNGMVTPQPGIVKFKECINDAGNIEFKTPMTMALDFCDFLGQDNDVTMYLGEIDYYAKTPFYLVLLREIYFPNGKNKVEAERLDNKVHDTRELKHTALEVFERMKEFPSKYGFHLSYSPESSWKSSTEYLILTINPQSKNTKGKNVKIVPDSPWPKINDFFDDSNPFKLKKPVQAICYELSRLCENPECKGASPMEAAHNFADNCAIIASFVPFRTEDANRITEEMTQFAKEKYWGELFKHWQPGVIVTLGQPPFTAMEEFLNEKFEKIESSVTPVSEKDDCANLSFRLMRFKTDSGKIITIVGLPHPAAFGDKGLPTGFPDNAEEDSFCRQFFQKYLED